MKKKIRDFLSKSSSQSLSYNNFQFEHEQFEKFPSETPRIHNILMIVGNGFDISVLKHLNSKRTTTYDDFFFYLNSQSGFNCSNALYVEMERLKKDPNASNWSDFEEHLERMVKSNTYALEDLQDDLTEIQAYFSKFLNDTVNSDFVNQLNKQAEEGRWAINTFQNFLGDLPEEEFKNAALPVICDHYDIFNFDVINLNFTPLLDSYLYLDRNQYIPHPHKDVDTNFNFRRNPRRFRLDKESIEEFSPKLKKMLKISGVKRGSKRWKDRLRRVKPDDKTTCSSYLITNMYHPHGQQDIPRSLLFGIDDSGTPDPKVAYNEFTKKYWGQLDKRFLPKINQAQTFIIFGASLGSTDRFWWTNILKSAINNFYADIIIYKYCRNSFTDKEIASFRENFLESNFPQEDYYERNKSDFMDCLRKQTHVVFYTNPEEINALGFKKPANKPEYS